MTQFMSLTQRTPWLNYDSTTDWWLSAIIKISWWEDKKKFSLLFNSLVNSRLNRIFNAPLIRSIDLHSPKNRFISLSRRFADLCEFNSPILVSIPASGPAGYWEGKLCKLCRSTTLWPWLRSVHWLNHVRVKWVPCVFPLWSNSNSRVRLEPLSRSFHPLIG